MRVSRSTRARRTASARRTRTGSTPTSSHSFARDLYVAMRSPGGRARRRRVQVVAAAGAAPAQGEGRPAGGEGDHRVGRVHRAARRRRIGRGPAARQRLSAVDPLPGRRPRQERRPALSDRPASLRRRVPPRRGGPRAREVATGAREEELRARRGPAEEPRDLAGGVRHPRVEPPPGGGIGRGSAGGGGCRAARRRVHPCVGAGCRAGRAEARHGRQPHQRRRRDAGHAAHDDRLARPDLRVLRGRRGLAPQVQPPRSHGATAKLARLQEPGARGARRRGGLSARRRHGLRRQPGRPRHRHDRRPRALAESRPEPHPRALRPPAAAGQRTVSGNPPSRRGDQQRPVAEVRVRGRRRQQGPVPHGEDRAAGRRAAGDPRGRHTGGVGRRGRSPADAARVPGRRAAMNISRFFIDRPIFAAVLSIVTLILGGIAYQSLPVAQYPEVVPPTIVVQASYPGAPPEVIADTVATPIEQEVNGVEDMLYMSSQSTTDGQMTLTITFRLPVTTLGRLREPEEFENVIVKTGADGRITRVRDVARIELAARDYSVNSYLDNQPAVAMAIAQLPGSNALATADAVERTMEEMSRSFPEGLAYKIVYNPTVFVRESINEVIHTLFEAVGLVVIVVLVFLQTWRASLIPLLAIPVSLVGTVAAMKAFGFSLNMLSLFGLVLAIGIVVDDAIVVVENR